MVEGGEHISLMRAFRYFPHAAAGAMRPDVERVGSSAHTDWGFL